MGKPVAVGKDVLTCFHLAMATQTLGALYREKVLSELPNGRIARVALAHKVTNSPINGSQPPPLA